MGRSRSWLYRLSRSGSSARRPRRPELVDAVRALLPQCPTTYGYRRIHALLEEESWHCAEPTVYQIMKRNGWLSSSRVRTIRPGRLHEGRVAVPEPNTRWCSDISDIPCWNGTKARLAVIVDCADRSALAWRCGLHITGEDLCEMLREALFARFGEELWKARGLEFLSDNGAEYRSRPLRRFLAERGMVACRTPIRSPQSNGIMESYFGWFKRDYVNQHPIETLESLQRQIPAWMEHHNRKAPHSALGMKPPARYYEEWLRADKQKNKKKPVHN